MSVLAIAAAAKPEIPIAAIANAVFGGRLKVIYSGGAYLSSELQKDYYDMGIRLLQGYGMTECSPRIATPLKISPTKIEPDLFFIPLDFSFSHDYNRSRLNAKHRIFTKNKAEKEMLYIMFPENYVSGKYAVGTEVFSITDSTRKEQLGAKDVCRKISVRMYYPVLKSDVDGKEPARIFSERKMAAVQKAFHIKKFDEKALTADYYENIPHTPGEKYPLIMFNHGYNSYVEANTYLCIELASHGYIIASVGHAYEAVENDYEDGSFDLYDKNINKIMYTSMIKAILAQRKLLKKTLAPKDAYDEFQSFQDTYVPYIKGRVPQWRKDNICVLDTLKQRYLQWVDFSCGVGASGHSLGGALAYNLCQYEEDFACGINIDGALFGEYENRVMSKPFFQICCKENYNCETRPLLDTTAPVHYAVFSDMKHIGFTDAKFCVPIKALVGKMEPIIMYKHLSDIHIRFFDKYLKKLPDTEIPSGEKDGISYR